jgi:Bacterial Ig domain
VQGTAQVSRYPIKSWASLGDGEQLDDVLPVNLPCSPDFGPNLPACVRRVNRTNVPHSAAGTSPFIGDYVALTPAVQFVKDATGWRWATAADVADAGFHAAFADNRNLIPPTSPPELLEWQRYPNYSPPGQGGSCVNGGSRNTDVITSRVAAQLVVSAPTTFKQLGTIQRAFPLSVANGTGSTKFYRLSFLTGGASASFSQSDPDIDSGDVQLFPYSSTTRVVYVSPTATGFVTIQVREIDAYGGAIVAGGLSGTATINADSSNPEIAFSDPTTETHDPFVQNPFVQNPFVQNPFVQNPFVQNTSPSNPFVQNPFVQNPFVQNVAPEDVIDVTWTVQNVGNTTSTYLASVNVDNAEAFVGNYAFQLIVWKQSSNGGLQDCNAINEGQAEIIANVVQNPFVQNPFVQNPFVQNPFVQNPFVQNPFVQNSTFAIAPADTADTSTGTLALSSATIAAAGDDGTTKQPRPQDEIKVTLRAFRINANSPVVFDPVLSPPSLVVTSETKNIVQGQIVDSIPTSYISPDVVISGGVGGSLSVSAGSSFVFPASGFSVVNNGNDDGETVDGTIRYGIYLSSDATITPEDTLLGFVTSTGSIAAGETQTFAGQSVTIPAGLDGTYYIGVLSDDQLEISELDETNNWASVPILITGNTPPAATSQSVTTTFNTPVSITLAGTDADGDTLAFTVVDGPSHGTLSGSGATLIYTPAAGYYGSDSFTFKANDGSVDSAPATVSIFVSYASLTLTKGASPTTYGSVGQTITYSYGVTNSGNITLSGTLSIADDKLGTIACGAVTLAPGAATTCSKSYTTVQGDIDARAITNTASASLAGVTSNSASRTVTSTVINGRLNGGKYYDGGRNGIRDASDAGIGSWRINVYSGTTLFKTFTTAADGTFAIALPPGSYTLQEARAQSEWTQTGNIASQFTSSGGMTIALSSFAYAITIPATGMSDATGLYFGNACTIIPGGLSQGFWGTKNAAKLIGSGDLQALRDLPLVNSDGSPFDPTNVRDFQAWLNASATGQNMADQLSGHLAALLLNLRHQYTNPIATVDGTRTTTAEVAYASSLIAADPFTPSGDPNRAEQERVKTLIMDVNSGKKFPQTLQDACPAPVWQ